MYILRVSLLTCFFFHKKSSLHFAFGRIRNMGDSYSDYNTDADTHRDYNPDADANTDHNTNTDTDTDTDTIII